MSITPMFPDGQRSKLTCATASCGHEMKGDCPNELRLWGAGWNSGHTLGCKSACVAFKTDQYCCRGKYQGAEKCDFKKWPENYIKYFKEKCPNAFSYLYDDRKNTFSCDAEGYLVTIG